MVAGDCEGEQDAAPVGVSPFAAHEQHARTHEDDAERLEQRRASLPRSRAHQNEHRRDAAGDRVDEADVRAPVGGRQQEEVRELEHDGRDDPRDGRRLHFPGKGGDGREQDDPHDERDGRCCAYVLRAGDEDVPARVECGRAEREQERVERQLRPQHLWMHWHRIVTPQCQALGMSATDVASCGASRCAVGATRRSRRISWL